MKRMNLMLAVAAAGVLAAPQPAGACTGITLRSADGAHVVARTIEWGGSDLNSRYVVVPRGYAQRSFTPGGQEGMRFTARYGYVGFAVEREEFVAEGLNEEGLSAGLFYFPGYGAYEPYDAARNAENIADLQLVPLVLGSCRTIDEVKELLAKVCVIGIDPRASTVHWRFTDLSGRQVVLEIIDRKPVFYENELGVLTNSPGFEWQLTNLNNYVNLHAGGAEAHPMGGISLAAFGAGSGMLGLPGDVTPPSRFVRAAFFQTTAPQQATALEAVLQGFQILTNFDIPIGVEFPAGQIPADIPSATQWTSATDPVNRVIYYRTMYNSAIRSIDLQQIDFSKVAYRSEPLDDVRQQPVCPIRVQ
ncbi:choloylglycine hydrolase family protein [uncultured Alistipes sp.]|uniref:choloylglycine hydrolase family protein n=1 Tax=uncultured Alistipes sp. TaxID=538949 RepID=UPI001F8F91CF|nr:choloylglycine hydrolase family protein [uncultured Alistipes sp.]HJC27026.1 choloylglycine hydrolase family protein [Candidatus Alistipes stercoravium]